MKIKKNSKEKKIPTEGKGQELRNRDNSNSKKNN